MKNATTKLAIDDGTKGLPAGGPNSAPSFETRLLTTEEVCQKLNISTVTLHSRIKEGRFHPVRQGTRNYFNIDEIAAEEKRMDGLWRIKARPDGGYGAAGRLPASASKKTETPTPPRASAKLPEYNGDVASAAFELFDQGQSQRDAVKTLKLTCEIVEHLYDKWKAFGSEWHLPPQALAQARKRLEWWEEPPTAKGFIAALNLTIQRETERIADEAKAAESAGPVPLDPDTEPQPETAPPPRPEPPAAVSSPAPAPKPAPRAPVAVDGPLSPAEIAALQEEEALARSPIE